jgi:hypothetical protein
MSNESITYIGLCGRTDPPLIGIVYKNRPQDEKKKMYQIHLQKLVLNPNADEVVEQLYREHSHILKEATVPKSKIIEIFSKIQHDLNLGDEGYEDNYEE